MFVNDITTKYCLSLSCLLLWLFSSEVECHIGQPCNSLLRVCLPISSHIYCDDSNTCRCKKEYPIVVGAHTCLAPKRVSDRCSHPEECLYWDKNAFCNQSPYSSRCECNTGYVYDKNQRLCVRETKNTSRPSNTTLMIPTAAGFLMACFSLLCCCALIWHNLCRRQDLTPRSGPSASTDRNRNRRNQRVGRGSGQSSRRNASNLVAGESHANHLPPYESILIDSMNNDPPPTYEEAIKDSQLPQVMASGSDAAPQTKVT